MTSSTEAVRPGRVIARVAPKFAFFLVVIVMASAGLPALCGFPGEFMILVGTFTGGAPLAQVILQGVHGGVRLHQVLAIVAASGVILAAVYLLWMTQKVLFGPLQDPANEHLEDMNTREVFVLVPFVLMAVVLGIAPGFFMEKFEPSVSKFVTETHQRAGQVYAADPGVKRFIAQREPPDAKRAPRLVLPGGHQALGATGLPEVVRPARAADGRLILDAKPTPSPH